jgi:hypothetical protein
VPLIAPAPVVTPPPTPTPTPVPVPPGPGPGPLPVPAPIPVGSVAPPVPPTLTYIDPDGVVWPWSDIDNGYQVTALAGFGAPPVELSSQALPGGGAWVQSVRRDAGEPLVGLLVQDPSQAGYLQRVRWLRRALTHDRAGVLVPGTLRMAWPDGTARRLSVLCVDGMPKADADPSNEGLTWGLFSLRFFAPDPLWQDEAEVHLQFGLTPTSSGILPLLPINLAPSSVLGDVTVVVDGDATAYPRWVIHGPGTPTLTNYTTGRAWSFGVALGSTATLTVDTRPTKQTVVDGTGADRWADMGASPSLWTLEPGTNRLGVALAGSGAGSQVDLYYTPRRLGP